MNIRKRRSFWLALALTLLGLTGGFMALVSGRPAPVPLKMKIVPGVRYQRIVHYFPHSMVAHVLTIDKKTAGLHFFVTPPDNVEGGALRARTTSQFLEEFDLLVAINGGGFTPWWSRSPVDYYPRAGDPVTPQGFSASRGIVYARSEALIPPPTLYISRKNEISYQRRPDKVFHALSGDRVLIRGGEILPNLDNVKSDPRTAIGVNPNGRWTYLVVVDGRQPFYSQGATFQELAQLLHDLGAYYAISLDGGGSATMVMAGADGQAVLLNAPIDQYIPLRERPVANHFGVYLK